MTGVMPGQLTEDEAMEEAKRYLSTRENPPGFTEEYKVLEGKSVNEMAARVKDLCARLSAAMARLDQHDVGTSIWTDNEGGTAQLRVSMTRTVTL